MSSLLKNSTVNFDYFDDIDDYIVQDYKSKSFDEYRNIDLSKFKVIDTLENSFTEGISFKEYKNVDYWDLILLTNDRDGLFDSVYSFDIIKDLVDEISENYFREYQGNLNQEFIEAYKENLINKLVDLNFKNSKVKILKPNEIKKLRLKL